MKPGAFRFFTRAIFFATGLLLLTFSNALGQNVRKIEIIYADIIQPDNSIGKGGLKLLGNVQFKHEGALMSCDSSYYYSETNSLDAFSKVKIEQGDTLFLYGDRVHYEGESKIAKVRNNVKLIDDSTVLVTEYLDYNRETKTAYYLNGGHITEGDNTLTSQKGYYYTETEIFNFKNDVVIVNPDYTIKSDTLEYNTKTKVTYFFGPTEIVGEENYLYCERGWYDTDLDISHLTRAAFLKRDSRTLNADTLYYERETGYGQANSRVVLYDSAENSYLKGNYGIYNEFTQLSMITDSALMIQVDGPDSMFVHADTLRTILDTASLKDEKILLAYNKVKIFRSDIQAMCDSLTYMEKDSTFHFFKEPILWSGENQINATKIELVMKNEELYRLYLRNIALLISKEDSTKYNQMRGKDMLGHFKQNDLVQLDVTGNGQTVYYAEEGGVIIGANRLDCTDLTIYLEDNKVKDVLYNIKPSGNYYPLHLLPENMRFLDGFSWNDNWRPKKSADVFFWKESIVE